MTGFQAWVIAWLGGASRRVCGRYVNERDIRANTRLAERVYWELN